MCSINKHYTIKIDNLAIRPINTPLLGFTGSPIMLVGEFILPLSMGELPVKVTEMTRFPMVDHPSAYNVILGRLAIHDFRTVPSTYHMAIKFPTRCRVNTVRGDQVES